MKLTKEDDKMNLEKLIKDCKHNFKYNMQDEETNSHGVNMRQCLICGLEQYYYERDGDIFLKPNGEVISSD